jgi:hypothetical protein
MAALCQASSPSFSSPAPSTHKRNATFTATASPTKQTRNTKRQKSRADDVSLQFEAQAQAGFKHMIGTVPVRMDLVGKRLQYRFEEPCGWVDGVISKKCSSSATGSHNDYELTLADGDVVMVRLFVSEHGLSRRWVMWEWDAAAAAAAGASALDIPIAQAPTGWHIDAAPTALNTEYLDGLCESDRRVMYRWGAPHDWCEGRVKSVVGPAKDNKVKIFYSSDRKESTSKLIINRYGVQGDWVALTRVRKRKLTET